MSNSVRFSDLALGTAFSYIDSEKTWIKISDLTIVEWDETLKTACWVGQRVCSFDENDDTSKIVSLGRKGKNMADRVKINKDILRQCREQIGMSLSFVAKEVAEISYIENFECKPSFEQLNILSKLYQVPRWVFISDEIPERYRVPFPKYPDCPLCEANDEIESLRKENQDLRDLLKGGVK